MSGNQLREAIRKLGLTQDEAADSLGITRRTLQNWFKLERLDANISHNVKDNLGIDFSFYENRAELKSRSVYGGEDAARLIPFYDEVASIGGVNERVANMDGVSAPTDYIDTGDWFRDATAAIRHYGDSMTEYPNGCILAIKEVYDRELIVPGRDYVIETSEYRVTKRVQRGESKERITAYSTNPETYPDGRLIHEPFDIPFRAITHIFLVLGYVVKKNGGTMVFSSKRK